MTDTYQWYHPSPNRWVRCTITARAFSLVTATAYGYDEPITGRVRKIAGAEIVE